MWPEITYKTVRNVQISCCCLFLICWFCYPAQLAWLQFLQLLLHPWYILSRNLLNRPEGIHGYAWCWLFGCLRLAPVACLMTNECGKWKYIICRTFKDNTAIQMGIKGCLQCFKMYALVKWNVPGQYEYILLQWYKSRMNQQQLRHGIKGRMQKYITLQFQVEVYHSNASASL